jgi:GcrA cell cycle regulator
LWSEERIGRLTTLWSQGVSATRIARELGGGISRGSVLAKIHRLGISGLSPYGGRRGLRPGRQDQSTTTLAPTPANVPRPIWLLERRKPPDWVVNAIPYVDDPLVDAGVPPEQRRSILQLNDRTCRWPVGDPASSDFFFCGAAPLAGQAYCATHWRPRLPTARADDATGSITFIEVCGEVAAAAQSVEEEMSRRR